jgi:hypothetical protein
MPFDDAMPKTFAEVRKELVAKAGSGTLQKDFTKAIPSFDLWFRIGMILANAHT